MRGEAPTQTPLAQTPRTGASVTALRSGQGADVAEEALQKLAAGAENQGPVMPMTGSADAAASAFCVTVVIEKQ
jgi:hypothetical protein